MSMHGSLRRLAAALLALVALIGAAATPPARAQEARLVWSAIPGVPADVVLEDLFMLGEGLAWVAARSRDGSAGYAYRLELGEGRWQVERAGTFRAGSTL